MIGVGDQTKQSAITVVSNGQFNMRVLVAHNRYQQHGGEDVVFDLESSLLENEGIEVERFEVTNDKIKSIPSKISTLLKSVRNVEIARRFADSIRLFRPDVVHIHNFFPQLSPSIISVAIQHGSPVVHTAHNFRHVCAGALFLRENAICQDCLGHPARLPALLHRCYRNSLPGTLATVLVGQRFKQLFLAHPRYLTLIALTEFAKQQLVLDGFPANRIRVKGNSTIGRSGQPSLREKRIVFVGRLSSEKGVDHVLTMAKAIDAEFEIIGSGPQESTLRSLAPANVRFVGRLPQREVLNRISSASAVVVPSRWYEGFPMVVVEAYSTGTPVIASRLGSLEEIVDDGVTGFTVPLQNIDTWIEKLQSVLNDPDLLQKLQEGALRAFERKYTAKQNASRLLNIYEDAQIRAAQPSGPHHTEETKIPQ